MSNNSGSLPSSLRARSLRSLISDLSAQIKISIIAVMILAIFFNDIYTMGAQALVSGFYNYVLIIPFMMAYLIYRKRRVLAALLPLKDEGGRGYLNPAIGICGLLASLLVYVYGVYTTDPLTYHLISLEIFLACSILLLFNRQIVRTLAVPILLINAALPAAVTFGLSFWYTISLYSIYPAYVLLKLFGLDVAFIFSVNAPTIQLIGPTGTFQFAVSEASSGIYSFVGFTVFALFVAYIATGSLWKKILLFAIGYALLIPINTLREMILITAANFWGIGAFTFFHITSGIVLITIVTLLLLVVGDRLFHLTFFLPMKTSKACDYCSDKSLRSDTSFCLNCGRFLKRLQGSLGMREIIAVEAMVLIFLLFFVSLAPAYANAQTPSSVNISSTLTTPEALTFLPNITGYSLSYVGPDINVQEQLGADAILLYSYSSNLTSFSAVVEVLTAYHTPDTSIVQHVTNYGLKPYTIYANTNLEIPVTRSATPLTGGYVAFQVPSSNQTEAILWWNLRALFNFGSFNAYRTVQIWLIDLPQSPNQVPAVKESLLPIASQIASWWEPKLTYSIIQTSLKQSSLPLAGAVMIPAIVFAGNETVKKARDRRSTRNNVTKFRGEGERKLLESLNSLKDGGHSGRGTLEQITKAYNSIAGQNITLAEASLSMTYLEYLGLVEKKIVEVSGVPIQMWQSHSSSQTNRKRFLEGRV